jgi:hypothetical protein
VRESEGGWRRFGSAPSKCGMAAVDGMRHGRMGGSGLGVLRKEKGTGWASLVRGNRGGVRRLGSMH